MKYNNVFRTIAFIFLIWSLLMLAVSLPNLYMGPEEKAPPLPTSTDSGNMTENSTSGDFGRVIYLIFIGSLIFLSALYIVSSILRKDNEAFKEIMAGLFVIILVSGFFMAALHITDHPEAFGESLGERESGSGGGDSDTEIVEREKSAGAIQYIILLFILIIVFAITAMIISSLKSEKIKKVKSQSEEIRKKISMAIEDLKKGGEVQDIIIRCYDEMCMILSKSSGIKGDSMTPREFEEAIMGRMDIDRKPVISLTSLFEEAKYSPHPIDNNKRMEAIVALENLKQEVEAWERENGL